MDKKIYYFEGNNNVGKTTLIHKLTGSMDSIKSFELGTTNKISSSKWWFYESEPIELINELLKLIEAREVKITKHLDSKICLEKATLILANFIRCKFCASVINPIALDNEPSWS